MPLHPARVFRWTIVVVISAVDEPNGCRGSLLGGDVVGHGKDGVQGAESILTGGDTPGGLVS